MVGFVSCRPARKFLSISILLGSVCSSFLSRAQENSTQEISAQSQATSIRESELEPIGGHWYVSKVEPKTYYYRDGDQIGRAHV